MTDTQFQTGFSTDLVGGLDSAWDPAVGRLNVLLAPKQQAMEGQPVTPIDHRGTWSGPTITLHDDVYSLLNELIPYRVVSPSSETDAPTIGAGALLCGNLENKAALTALSNVLGVDLTNGERRYALVKLDRVDGTETHPSASDGILVHAQPRNPDPEYGIRDDFRSMVARLRHSGNSPQQDYGDALSQDIATQILDSFANFGTHYVSAVQLGDTVLQVFTYTEARFETIKKAYADGKSPLSGQGSEHFAQFTTDSSTGAYGFVSEYGHVLSLSNSTAFTTAITKGDWLDNLWSKKNSVFSLFNSDSPLTFTDLQREYTDQVVSQVQLASLGVMIEQKRRLLWQRVLKGALLQQYRDTIEPNFAVYDLRDFSALLPADQTGFVSTIATPTVNVYKSRIELPDVTFVAPSQVRSLTMYANVLSAGTATVSTTLPGSQIRLFAQIMDMRGAGAAKQFLMSDTAFHSVQIACDEFLGALVLRSDTAQDFTAIVDGLQFGLRDGYPAIVADVRTVPPAEALPDLVDSIQYSMSFAEAVMSDQTGSTSDVVGFVRSYLTWLAKFIPATATDPTLLALRVRAMDLANFAINPAYGSFVPILPYTDYKEYVDSILNHLDRIRLQISQNEQRMAERRTQELVIDVGKTLNENIIASGKLVSGIIDANADQQKDLAGYYQSLINQKQAEADQQQLKVNQLRADLTTAQGDVDLAVQQYKSAVQQWETIEAIKFGLDVATNLFSLGTTLAIPSTSIAAVKELGTTVQMIQKTLNVLNAMSKLYTGASSGIKGLQGAQTTLDGLDGAQFGSPASVNWDEMQISFNEIMATGPDVKVEKAALQSAFSILILRGKAVTSADASLHQLYRDIYTNQQQKDLNAKQAKRWQDLKDKFQPAQVQDLDKDAIDLIGMSGYLEDLQKQMLTILAQAFRQQDLALQYAYLQPATPVGSFSLMDFSAAIVQQQSRTIEAKSALAPHQAATTTPIDFVVEGVLPSQVTGGNTLTSTICLDAAEFLSYVDAKVVSVVATVDGVKGTDSGNYHLRLTFNGTPFQDRNIERETLTFRTPWRERVYQYRAADGSPAFTDEGKSWSTDVSPVTPFGTWEISFPQTKTNAGLCFDRDHLTVHLSFVLEARVVDPDNQMRLRATRRASALLHASGAPIREIPKLLASDSGLARLTNDVQSQPSTHDLIAQMYAQGCCTNGWDVVFSLGLDEINNALRSQYETLQMQTTYKNSIQVSTSATYPGNVTVRTEFTISYGYPLLTFGLNNSTTQLQMKILDGKKQDFTKIGDQPEIPGEPTTITGETLTANIVLEQVTGTTTIEGSEHKVLKVVLDMSTGTFTISNIQLSDESKVAFNSAVKAYFVTNPVCFLINQLDLTANATLDALKPNSFIFKMLKTPSDRRMLQLFIQTGSRSLLDASQAFLNNVAEPLPLGQSSSMMIRSQLVFQEILPKSLKNSGWTLSGAAPVASPAPGDPKAWSSQVDAGSVSGTVDLSGLHSTSSAGGGGGGSSTDCTYSIPGGNTVNWPLTGTAFVGQSDGQLRFSGSRTSTLAYNQHSCTTYWPCFWDCTSCSDQTLHTDFVLNVSATLPLAVGGSGRAQTITVSTTGKAVTVGGHLSGGGPCGSDDLQAQVNSQIQAQLPNQIASNLSMTFDAISVFALKNLLFPEGNYISFSASAIPGDLLLVGNFTTA